MDTTYTQQLKVLVVEDELPILNNLIQKINKIPLPFEVVAAAHDGEEALAVLKENRIDVLFTDIKMPVLDGIELIRQAKLVQPHVKVVIISGYDDFAYAQSALRHGVFDYLLKPVNIHKLRDVLELLLQSIRKESHEQERQIITSSLSGHVSAQPGSLPTVGRGYRLILIVLGNLQHPGVHHNLEVFAGLWHKLDISHLLSQQWPHLGSWWIVDEKSPNTKMLIHTIGSDNFAQLLYEKLLAKGQGLCPITLCSCQAPLDYTDLWQQAQKLRSRVWQQLRPCQSAHIWEESTKQCQSPIEFGRHRTALADYCKAKQGEPIKQLTAQLLAQWQQVQPPQVQLETALFEMIAILAEQGAGAAVPPIGDQIKEIISCNVSEAVLYQEIQQTIVQYVAQLFPSRATARELYEDIRQYIDDNYLTDLSVDNIAETFNFSSSYITRIFKKYGGQPPIRYLIQLRIQKAKELICQYEQLSLQQISEMVGYPDAHYFSRTFRNMTGQSPTEYKKSVSAGDAACESLPQSKS